MNQGNVSTRTTAPELVFGLIGPTGVDIDGVQTLLKDCLQQVGYASEVVSVTKWLEGAMTARGQPVPTALDERISVMQDEGNKLRENRNNGDAMALVAITMIRDRRRVVTNDPDLPASHHAYIVRQLKHPDEVRCLRELYGTRFVAIAIYAKEDARITNLTLGIVNSRDESSRFDAFGTTAEGIIRRDSAEEQNPLGQRVRDVFPMADFFLDTADPNTTRSELQRFVELLFGNEFRTPRVEEYLMFQARAAALRSADLSRQVGAVIATSDGSIVSVGMNDVPRIGGRWYIDGDSPDHRDFKMPVDKSEQLKREALKEILDRLRSRKLLSKVAEERDPKEFLNEVVRDMEGTRLMGIGEFGRSVHAEMAALLDAAKRGVAVNDTTLFTTTFPCQNCVKHIIAAGIRRIVFMDPYPKSLAAILYSGVKYGPMLPLSDPKTSEFDPESLYFGVYIGVAPRQYMNLFSMNRRRGADGNALDWRDVPKNPRGPFSDGSTMCSRELEFVRELDQIPK